MVENFQELTRKSSIIIISLLNWKSCLLQEYLIYFETIGDQLLAYDSRTKLYCSRIYVKLKTYFNLLLSSFLSFFIILDSSSFCFWPRLYLHWTVQS